MPDKVTCPYCGKEMRLAMSQTHYRCPVCNATSPWINDLHTAVITPVEVVKAAAMRRYEPADKVQIRSLVPLTYDELWALAQEGDNIVWGEYLTEEDQKLYGGWAEPVRYDYHLRNGATAPAIDFYVPGWESAHCPRKEEYGIKWRCWPCRPADDERSAAAWKC